MLKSRSINRTSFLVNMANIFLTKQTQSGVPKLIFDCNQKSANRKGNRRQLLSHLSLLLLYSLSLFLVLFPSTLGILLLLLVSLPLCQLSNTATSCLPRYSSFLGTCYLAALSRLCLCLCSSNCIRQPVQLGAF